MAYRKTKRSKETLSRMKAGKDAARMARPAPDYPPELPDLRRRIVIEDFDFGHRVHVLELYRTRRVDCFRVVVDGKPWKDRLGFSAILAGIRKSLPRVGAA
jgi:hypothetical protein